MTTTEAVDALDGLLDRVLTPRMLLSLSAVLALCVAARRSGAALAPALVPRIQGWILAPPGPGAVQVLSPFEGLLAAATQARDAGYGWGAVPLAAALVAARWRSRGSSFGFGFAAATAAAALLVAWWAGVAAHAAWLRAGIVSPPLAASDLRPFLRLSELNPMRGGLLAVAVAAAVALVLPWPSRARPGPREERGVAAGPARLVKAAPLERRSASALAALTFAYWAWLAFARGLLLVRALASTGRGHAGGPAVAPLHVVTATAWTIALPIVAAFAVKHLVEGRARGVALARLLAAWAVAAHLVEWVLVELGLGPALLTGIMRLSLNTAYRLSPSSLTVDLAYGIAALAIAREVRRRARGPAAEPPPGGCPRGEDAPGPAASG